MRFNENEIVAVRIEALWKRTDLSDNDRRELLNAARSLQRVDQYPESRDLRLGPSVTATVDRIEQRCGIAAAANEVPSQCTPQ
jgi:hypothetical protein